MSNKKLPIIHRFPQVNDDKIIWRYMSFYQFLWLLLNQGLYQPSISSFNDAFEGSLPKNTKEDFENSFAEWLTKWEHQPISGELKEYYEKQLVKLEAKRRLLRNNTFASCWCLRDTESEALWKLYCKSNNGIVIKTKYGKLKEYASSYTDMIGKVTYINYETETIDFSYPVNLFMYKRKSFDFESEVRILSSYEVYEWADVTLPNYQVIKIPVDKLVEDIVVYPYSTKYFIDIVRSVVGKYSQELSKKVRSSELIIDPIY